MLSIDALALRLWVARPAVLAQAIEEGSARANQRRKDGSEGKDGARADEVEGLGDGFMPRFDVAGRQDDLGVGVGGNELREEEKGWHAGDGLFRVSRLASRRGGRGKGNHAIAEQFVEAGAADVLAVDKFVVNSLVPFAREFFRVPVVGSGAALKQESAWCLKSTAFGGQYPWKDIIVAELMQCFF